MFRLATVGTVLALIATSASAAPCHNSKGQFAKCPPPAGSAGMPSAIVKDKGGRCHWSATENGHTKGQFTACPK